LFVSESETEHREDNKTIAKIQGQIKKANEYLEDLF